MILIKALLTVLIGVSLCIADISGIVTDTSGTISLSGAAVQLEKSGQTAVTGVDGRFTLVVSTVVSPRPESRFLRSKLSASIHNNILYVKVSERSDIDIVTFALTGKMLSKVQKTLNAGMYSITLPRRKAGVYLYKLESGNREFVLKGNSVGGASSGSAVSSEGPSSNSLAKQVKITVAINDVIAATKTGYLNYRVVVYNSDTSGIAIKMIASAGTVTDADGNVYQTVRIGNQVWMAENLRVTKYNDGSAIPLDTSIATWNNATTPKYCFYNNTTDSGSIKKYGALYNWYVVSPANLKKIAPAGWHRRCNVICGRASSFSI